MRLDVTCPEPTDLSNGFIECSGIQFGDRCEFSCDLGYELDGSRAAECKQSGNFEMINGYPPACLRMLKFQIVSFLFLFMICIMLLKN